MLLIVDEAQTGLGRLGAMFGFERDGVVPDLLDAVEDARRRPAAGGDDDHRRDRGGRVARGLAHITSHVADPLPAAAGLAGLEVIETDGLVERADALGEYLLGGSTSSQCSTRRSATSAGAACWSASKSLRIARAERRRTRSAPPSRTGASSAASR